MTEVKEPHPNVEHDEVADRTRHRDGRPLLTPVSVM
jgi:hypothetical protein